MNCKPVLVGSTPVEAHKFADINYSPTRKLAEAMGGIVTYDQTTDQAAVVPPLAPRWDSFGPLKSANRQWPAERQMFQARCDYIWAAAIRIQVDPRLMLAILCQEGTGSFNTNPANAADYNGNGPDSDWIRDTDRAVSHVAGKLCLYRNAVAAGFATEAMKLGLQGTAIQFVNWPGPIADHSPKWGVYAQHADWWAGVSRFYEDMGGNVRVLSAYWQGGGTLAPGKLRCEAVTDRADLCSDTTGRKPRPGVVTWVE